MSYLSKPVVAAAFVVVAAVACSGSETTFVVEAGAGKGPAAEAFIGDFFHGEERRSAIVADTADHVVRAASEIGTQDLYTYESQSPGTAPVRCWTTNSSAGCGDSMDPDPKVTSGYSGSSEQDYWTHTSSLFWAPAAAAWFRVELSTGDLVTANVLNRSSAVLWNGDQDEYVRRATVLDADGDEIWAENFDQPPAPPVPPVIEVPEEQSE